MSADTPTPPADDDDLGPPVAELDQLSVDVDPLFADKVHNRIERRLLAGEFLDLFLAAPLRALLELLRAPFELLAVRRPR